MNIYENLICKSNEDRGVKKHKSTPTGSSKLGWALLLKSAGYCWC